MFNRTRIVRAVARFGYRMTPAERKALVLAASQVEDDLWIPFRQDRRHFKSFRFHDKNPIAFSPTHYLVEADGVVTLTRRPS